MQCSVVILMQLLQYCCVFLALESVFSNLETSLKAVIERVVN